MTDEDLQPGPCDICGNVNYPPSMGGPAICPACDCGDFGMERIKRLGVTITAARAEIERLAIENSRLSIQVIKAKEIVQALVACLNLNDQLMSELLRLSKNTRQPVDQTLIRSKLSFDDRMKKLLGQPDKPKTVLEM